MMLIDSFFDTFEKRSHFIYMIFILSALIFCFCELRVGINLLYINTYDEILSLVDQTYLYQSFFGKNALLLLNIQVFDLLDYLKNILISLQNHEIIYLFGIILLFIVNKKKAIIHSISFIIIFITIIIIFLLAVQSTSVYHLISYIKIIGIMLIIIYGIMLIYNIYQFIQTIKKYKESLKYKVIIIE